MNVADVFTLCEKVHPRTVTANIKVLLQTLAGLES